MILSRHSKNLLLIASMALAPFSIHADDDILPASTLAASPPPSAAPVSAKPMVTPIPPSLNAKAYILIDSNSGKIIAEKGSDEKLAPASLTKMMTLYVISNALHNKQIKLTDKVHISKEAWKTGGSRMFVKVDDDVTVEDLLKGIIVDSGNDACVAMAEHIGGSEQGFTELMNQQAKALGMKNSHFTDSTGLPDPELYTTAKDLAILGRALINNFPQYYHWYQQKWYTYNGIRQPNRNRLLWRDNQVDGVKTGHTTEAGFCLVASAKRNDMRLLSVVLGSPSDSVRANDSEHLLNYGFRFFETHLLYKTGQSVTELPVYKGKSSKLKIGVIQDQHITIPTGQYEHLNITTRIPKALQAPIERNQQVGEMLVRFDDKVVGSYPLYAMEEIPQGGLLTRMKDAIILTFKG